jgi:NitT/TauT family transport system ATP-binding protein
MLQCAHSALPVIELIDVDLNFPTPDGRSLQVLRRFNMSVQRGAFVALVGPTGCGKSTTLSLIAGLVRPTSGDVRVQGRRVEGIDPCVGFVFQADALFPWRTVVDNVVLGPLYRGMPKHQAYDLAAGWIATVGLAGFSQHYPHQLSGGMRKRVTLAQTFINRPEILLLDEPFSALDVQTRTLMQDELLHLCSTTHASVVFVTHDLEEAIALADEVYVLTVGPATVKSIYPIDLPRPRAAAEIRYERQFVDLSRKIWQDLREEVKIGNARSQIPRDRLHG